MPLFALGFRPFFLAAAVAAIALVALWVLDYAAWVSIPTYYGTINWHAHEMVFGYTAAVIAGFLLTSVRNWTNVQTLRGLALAALLGVWLAGRLAPFFPTWLPRWVVAGIDLGFLPVLALALAGPLVRRRQVRNLPFVPILLVLTAANGLVHVDALGIYPGAAKTGLYLGVDVILVIIAIIGGRVIPFFTERALPGARPRMWRPVEWLSAVSVVGLALSDAFAVDERVAAAFATLAAGVHGVRLWGWSDRRLWSVPLLWVLYLGYGWIVAGFALEASAHLGFVRTQLAVHAYTAGGIGALTLGMMARVALGHTGRLLQPARAMVVAFTLVNVAALLRVVVAGVVPDERYVTVVAAAGVVWVCAFTIFLTVYAPILTRPRVDGLPG